MCSTATFFYAPNLFRFGKYWEQPNHFRNHIKQNIPVGTNIYNFSAKIKESTKLQSSGDQTCQTTLNQMPTNYLDFTDNLEYSK